MRWRQKCRVLPTEIHTVLVTIPINPQADGETAESLQRFRCHVMHDFDWLTFRV